MESTRFETVNQAVSWAEARQLRQRAVCYVTRETDVLVLRHEPQPTDSWVQPGVQLPAGGVESGETPAQAAVREAFEETGLNILAEPAYLGSCLWGGVGWTGPGQVWHYFQLSAPHGTPDAWDHRVTGGEDTDMLFHLRFAPLTDHDLTPGQGSHEYLDELTALLSQPQSHRRSSNTVRLVRLWEMPSQDVPGGRGVFLLWRGGGSREKPKI